MFKEVSEVKEIKEVKAPEWLVKAAANKQQKDLDIDKPLVNIKKDVKASE